MNDLRFMREAFAEALAAYDDGEYPVGAAAVSYLRSGFENGEEMTSWVMKTLNKDKAVRGGDLE